MTYHSVPFEWKVIFEDTVLEISQECFFLLIVGGAIKAEITEPQQRIDLPQGGLEVLCMLILEHH